jgi:transposase
MATRQKFIQSTKERRLRTFSDEFKRQKVREIESKATTISEVTRSYDVGRSAVTNWIKKYNNNYMKGVKTIVEVESDTKRLLEKDKRIAELERIVGQKQLLIDFQYKMMELAEKEYNIDIKKKFEKIPSSTFGLIEKK